MSVGGSAGHSGQYAVDIEEGVVLGGNLACRRWGVTVRSRAAQLAEAEQLKQASELDQLEQDWQKIYRFLYQNHLHDGETRRQIELGTDLSRARVKKLIDAKTASGHLILQVRPKPAGNTTKDQTVYILNPSFGCLVEESANVGSAEPDQDIDHQAIET